MNFVCMCEKSELFIISVLGPCLSKKANMRYKCRIGNVTTNGPGHHDSTVCFKFMAEKL